MNLKLHATVGSVAVLLLTASFGSAELITGIAPPGSVLLSANDGVGPPAEIEIPVQATGAPGRFVASQKQPIVFPGQGVLENFELFIDQDPMIIYGMAFTDTGAPSTFGAIIQTPISPIANPQVAASVSGSVTKGGQAGVVTVTPVSPPAGIPEDGPDVGPLPDEIQVFTLSSDGGANFTSAGLDVGPAFTSSNLLQGFSDTIPADNQGFVPGPAGVWNWMRVDLSFGLSGGGDVATINGAAVIIPEPATWLILAMGAIAAAGSRRRLR